MGIKNITSTRKDDTNLKEKSSNSTSSKRKDTAKNHSTTQKANSNQDKETFSSSGEKIDLSNAARIMRTDPDPEKRKLAAKVMGHVGGLHSHLHTNRR